MASKTLGNDGGVFTAGTTKRSTLSMYDTAASNFQALPDGPYEASAVRDQSSAQVHFNATREIKLKDRHGLVLPPTSYRDHYPPKGPLPQEDLPSDLQGPGPGATFTARSEYDDQYFNKPRQPRPVDPLKYTHRPAPWLLHETTNQAFYKPFTVDPGAGGEPDATHRAAAAPPGQVPSIYDTTYRSQFTPKDAPDKLPVGQAEPRRYPPWIAGNTTYRDHYIPKDLGLQPVALDQDGRPFPFVGITEYMDEYPAKDPYAVMPPLTGVVSRVGLQLPLPRRSLGVEFWHKGQTNQYFVLIPRTASVPCRARQVFTTVHDNQEQACILVLYGDDPVASNNTLLGQFDIVNIPPAPKDVPRIEVTYTLDRDCFLSVEARDMDTERHKLWLQRGEIVVLRS